MAHRVEPAARLNSCCSNSLMDTTQLNAPDFFINIIELFTEKSMKMSTKTTTKMPYVVILKGGKTQKPDRSALGPVLSLFIQGY